jgi:hypothetical protein
MTAAPDRRHGFHVDTTEAREPGVRVLRVFVGPGAEYIDPDDVIGEPEYYREFLTRASVSRRVPAAQWEAGCPDPGIVARLARIDEAPSFLREGARVRNVPPGAIVAVATVPRCRMYAADIRSGRAVGWIHRSPAVGAPRCFAAASSV